MKKENKLKKNIIKKISFPPFYFFLCILLMILFFFLLPEYNKKYFPFNLFGILLLFFGLILIIRYTIIFNKYNTTLQNKRPSFFIKNGFYKYSRNPMYLGGLFFLLGVGVFLGNIISFIFPVIFFIIMNFISIPLEEEIMLDRFREEYQTYKKKVRRWL